MTIEILDALALVGFVASTIFGILGNVLTVLVLQKFRGKLGKALDPRTWRLMLNMAWCDMIFCFISGLMITWNRLAENSWPFNSSIMCFYFVIVTDLNNVSTYHTFLIALLRAVAVFLPTVYKRMIMQSGRRAVKLTIYVAPWFFGIVESVTSVSAGLYRIVYVERVHSCFPVPYEENDAKSLQLLDRLRMLSVLAYFILPFSIGGLLYLAILGRLWFRRKARRTQMELLDRNSNNANVLKSAKRESSMQERQYRAVLIIAWSLAVQVFFIVPALIGSFVLGLTSVHFVFGIYCCAYVLNPVVYAASSLEMRAEYKKLIRKAFSACKIKCLGHSSSSADVTIVSTINSKHILVKKATVGTTTTTFFTPATAE